MHKHYLQQENRTFLPKKENTYPSRYNKHTEHQIEKSKREILTVHIVKTLSMHNNESVLKAARGKQN